MKKIFFLFSLIIFISIGCDMNNTSSSDSKKIQQSNDNLGSIATKAIYREYLVTNSKLLDLSEAECIPTSIPIAMLCGEVAYNVTYRTESTWTGWSNETIGSRSIQIRRLQYKYIIKKFIRRYLATYNPNFEIWDCSTPIGIGENTNYKDSCIDISFIKTENEDSEIIYDSPYMAVSIGGNKKGNNASYSIESGVIPESFGIGNKQITLTLTNKGTPDLNLGTIVLTGDSNFSIVTMPDKNILRQNESTTIVVKFETPEEGEFLSTLTIQSNDPEYTTYTLNLIGKGAVTEPFFKPDNTTIYHSGLSSQYGQKQTDINGDGKMDLVIYKQFDGYIRVHTYISNGKVPVYSESYTIPETSLNYNVSFADITGDGSDDLILHAKKDEKLYVHVHESTGTSYTRTGTYYHNGLSLTYNAAFADVTGDGAVDMLLYTQNDGIFITHVLKSNKSTFNYIGTSKSSPGLSLQYQASFNDFTGDGKADLVLYAQDDDRFVAHIYASDGTNLQSNGSYYHEGLLPAYSVKFTDFNADDKTDIYLYKQDGQNFYSHILLSLGNNFTNPASYILDGLSFNYNVSLGDIDGDGLNDLLLHLITDQQLIAQIHRYNGTDFNHLSTYKIYYGFSLNYNIGFYDVTGDNLADLMMHQQDGDRLVIHSIISNPLFY